MGTVPNVTALAVCFIYGGSVIQISAARPRTVPEYAEFEIPAVGGDIELLNWMRAGWDLVGVHNKGKGQRKPLPVAIMRREQLQVA